MDNRKQPEYDPINDYRYPVSKLFEAWYLLERYGMDRFLEYCHNTGMPAQDIERVSNKHKYKTDPIFKAEIDKKKQEIVRKLQGSSFELKEEEIPF